MSANCSVIVTNFNKSPSQLEECMESIRNQTVAPREVILVDDCSDEPHAHADAISIILPKNVGVAKARDIGVKMSSGAALLFVDADDRLAPDFIQQCGKEIANADVVYTNILLFGEGRPKLVEVPSEIKPETLLKKCEIRVSSMMYRTMYDDLGGFKELPLFEDWEFWIRAMCNGYTFSKANTLLHYRQNPASRNRVSSDIKNEMIASITAPFEVVNDYLRERSSNG